MKLSQTRMQQWKAETPPALPKHSKGMKQGQILLTPKHAVVPVSHNEFSYLSDLYPAIPGDDKASVHGRLQYFKNVIKSNHYKIYLNITTVSQKKRERFGGINVSPADLASCPCSYLVQDVCTALLSREMMESPLPRGKVKLSEIGGAEVRHAKQKWMP